MIQRGFTLVELVIIIVLIGVLAVYAIPSSKSDLTAWNAADELMQAIRYSQQKSLDNTGQAAAGIQLQSQGFSFIGTTSLGITWNIQLPTPAYSIDISPTGTILFNGRGVPTCSGSLNCGNATESIRITTENGNSATIYIEPYTGLVHR